MRAPPVASSLVLLLALSACDGCSCASEARPPDAYDIERLRDPWSERSGSEPGDVVERAARLVDLVSADLGHGTGPGDVLRRRRHENWVTRVSLLLDRGGEKSLAAVHVDLIDTFTESRHTPADLKLQLRQSESRVQEAAADGLEDDARLRTLAAEIAWCLRLVATLTPDAGS